jgi:hypothetical protein
MAEQDDLSPIKRRPCAVAADLLNRMLRPLEYATHEELSVNLWNTIRNRCAIQGPTFHPRSVKSPSDALFEMHFERFFFPMFRSRVDFTAGPAATNTATDCCQ